MHYIFQSSLSRIIVDLILCAFFAISFLYLVYLNLMPVTTWPRRGLFLYSRPMVAVMLYNSLMVSLCGNVESFIT